MMDVLTLIPLAAVASALVSLLVAVLLVKTDHLHFHWSGDSSIGVQKVHTLPVTRVGGLAVLTGLLVGYGLAQPSRQTLLWPMLLASSPAFVFGLAEDISKRVSVQARLLATLACGVLGWALTGHSITDVNVPGLDWLLGFTLVSVLFTAFAVGGMANAMNMVDGINGLAAGATLIILCSFALIAHALGDTDLMRSCFILGGAVLGFLLVNWPCGKIFLGDGGAYLLGFAVAWLAVLMLGRHAEVSAWCPLLACACPVLEVGFSMLRRARRSRKLGAADRLHLHSLLKRRLARRLLPGANQTVRNSVTGGLMWLAGLLPAYMAVRWPTDTPALVLGFVICALLYSSVYARLTQFRWCISAATLHKTIAVNA